MSGTNPFSAFCDDFYVNMRLGSQLALPNGREQLLHYFERLGRDYPGHESASARPTPGSSTWRRTAPAHSLPVGQRGA